MERFSDDSLEQWIEDLQWASDDSKVRSLLQDIFHRRLRFSLLQARLWMRTIALFWRCGWSLREIGDQFGVTRQDVWRVVRSLRREAKRFFGDSPSTGQSGQQPEEPSSVHAESWGAFFEGTLSKKPRFQRLTKTTSPRRQIGTKVVEIDGRTYQVRIFEGGRPDGCFRFWANPRVKQAGPNREYDAEETKGILAHIPTAKDVEAAMDGDQEAREFLTHYNQIHDSKSNPLRVVEAIPKTTWRPTQSSPTRLVGQNEECVRCKRKSMTTLIDEDRAIHQQCESKSCAYVAVWSARKSKPTPKVETKHEHECIELSDLRTVPIFLNHNLTNNFTQGTANAP